MASKCSLVKNVFLIGEYLTMELYLYIYDLTSTDVLYVRYSVYAYSSVWWLKKKNSTKSNAVNKSQHVKSLYLEFMNNVSCQ